MALAVDASSNSGNITGQSSWTWSHTCSGSDRVLIVAVSWYTNTISGVTYNGVAMTQAVTRTQSTNYNTAIYYLVAPATGAHNIVVSFNAANYGRAGAYSFTGADQTNPIDTSGGATGTHASGNTINLTTSTSTIIVGSVALESIFATGLTATGADNTLYNAATPAGIWAGMYRKSGGSAGSKTSAWAWTTSFPFALNYATAAVAVKEGVVDVTAPTKPGTPSFSSITTTGANATWTASTDAVGVTSYDVYIDGDLDQNVPSNSATLTGLSEGTTYSVTVKAKDAAGNVSSESDPGSLTTQARPEVDLVTADDAVLALSPTLEFTGEDINGDAITYQIQIDTLNTFDSQ